MLIGRVLRGAKGAMTGGRRGKYEPFLIFLGTESSLSNAILSESRNLFPGRHFGWIARPTNESLKVVRVVIVYLAVGEGSYRDELFQIRANEDFRGG